MMGCIGKGRKLLEFQNLITKEYNNLYFSTQVAIMTAYREYAEEIFANCRRVYNSNTSEELAEEILDALSYKITDYIDKSIEIGVDEKLMVNNIIKNMKTYTKDYLIIRLKSNDSALGDFKDESYRKLYGDLNEVRRQLWTFGAVYFISGYEKSTKEQEEIQIEEMCNALNISRLRFKKEAFVVFAKLIKMYLLSKKEENSKKGVK